MIVAELIENLGSDIDRLLYLETLKKQITEIEKPLKENLIRLKLRHTQISYVERKDWKPSGKYQEQIEALKLQIKALEKESKDKKEGKFVKTEYIKVNLKTKEAPVEIPGKAPDMSDFFLSDPNGFS